MNDNTQQILSNANTTISSQYSQAGNVWATIDKNAASKAGKELAKEIQKGLKEGLSDLKGLNEPLNEIKNAFTKAISQATDPEKLKGAAGTAYKKFIKDIENEMERVSKLQDAINREMSKAVPDAKLILSLEQQRNEALEEAKRLNDLNQLTQELVLGIEQERLATQKLINAENSKERKQAEEELKAIQQKLAGVRDDINAITNNLKEDTEEINKLLEEYKDKINEGSKSLKDSITSFKDGLSSMQSTISEGLNLYNNLLSYNNIDTQIKNWSMGIDDYTKLSIQMGNTFGSGYSGTNSFNTLKNDIIDGITNGMEGVYDYNQITGMMKELTDFSFANNEIAVKMSGDLAFAKEYMGISSESLQSMYALQVRTGQDDYVKKSLNTIAALQKTGNSIGEQQLEAYNKSAMTLQDKLLDMGLTPEAASEAYSQIMQMADAADKAYGKGMGQQMIDTIMASLDWDHIGTMTGDWQGALQSLYSGQMGTYWDYIQNGPSATAAYNMMTNAQANNDYAAMFSMGQDDSMFQGVSDSLARQFKDPAKRAEYEQYLAENNAAVASNTDALDSMKESVEDALPEALKTANEKMTQLIELPWNQIANSIADENFAKTATNRFMEGVNMMVASISLLVTALNMQSMSSMFSGGTSTSGTGLKGLIQAFSKSKGGGFGTGMKALGKSALTAAKPMIGTIGIMAGVQSAGQMLSDGMNVGTNGFVDKNGATVQGTGGWGDGLAAAVTNSNIDATAGEDALSGIGKGAGIGAMIGSFIAPGIGTAIGGVIGAGVGALGSIFAHNRKEEAKEQAKLLKEQEEQTELAKITAANTEAIKNARDVALSDRYDDNRYGIGSVPAAAAPPPTNYGKGGDYNGIDIDGWSLTSDWEIRDLDNTGDYKQHNGIDFAGKPYGYPIGSASSGKVVNVVDGYTWKDGLSKANYVDIYNETNGITYRYYHLASAAVTKGQDVQAGNIIGYVGNTGNVRPIPTEANPKAGTHLHFAAMKGGTYTDPRPYVTSAMFYPGSTVTPSSDTSSYATESSSSIDATPYYSSFLPNFQTPMGSDSKEPSVQVVDSPSIIKGLEQINETLLAIDKRQNDQQKILDALTRTPIQSLGV